MREKTPWVRRKLAEFEALGPPPEPRQMVAGERFPYLGREYVLTLADGPPSPVALVGGSLEVDRALDGEARSAVIAWYAARAQDCIGEAVARFVPLVGAAPAAVVVRDLGKRRWGVCDHRTLAVSFHWQLVTQPPELIDYVVVHELAHLHEPNHRPAFWRVWRSCADAGSAASGSPARVTPYVLSTPRARRQTASRAGGRTSARRFTSMPAR